MGILRLLGLSRSTRTQPIKRRTQRGWRPAVEGMEPRALLATIATITQTATLPSTPTNFTGTPLAPSIALFNPALGTLVDVRVTETANLSTQITATNTSRSSGTTVTGHVQDNYTVTGLNVTLSQSQPLTTQSATLGPVGGTQPTSVTFPALVSTQTITPAPMTDAASLAFYTATAGQTTVTPAMSASASASITEVGGNATFSAMTTATATVTVSYDYIPGPPGIARFGVHMQPTSLVVTFNQPLTAADAQNVNNYQIIAAGRDRRFGTRDDVVIPINAANFNATTNAVTLIPAMNLNIYQPYELVFQFPNQSTPTVVPFNHRNLAGFNYHGGRFFAVVGGRVVR